MAARCAGLLGVVVTELVVVVVRLGRQRSTLGPLQLRSLKVEGRGTLSGWQVTVAGDGCSGVSPRECE